MRSGLGTFLPDEVSIRLVFLEGDSGGELPREEDVVGHGEMFVLCNGKGGIGGLRDSPLGY